MNEEKYTIDMEIRMDIKDKDKKELLVERIEDLEENQSSLLEKLDRLEIMLKDSMKAIVNLNNRFKEE